MSRRAATRLAWSLWALCLVVLVADAWVGGLDDPGNIATSMADGLIQLLAAFVGALIAARQPRNPIGWLLCCGIFITLLGSLALDYSVYALVTTHAALPGAIEAAVVGGWLRGLGWLVLPTFLLLLFPDGRLPSRRWRPAAWVVVVALAFNAIVTIFGQDLTDVDNRLAGVRNPFAFIGVDLANALQGVMLLLMLVSIGLCAAAVIVRFRRSRGIERQQLKWFTYAAALCLLLFLGVVVGAFANLNLPGTLFYLAIIGLPIGAGIAILRYRLYDIDVIINRTLVYGSLTALLAVIYFAVVIGLQALTTALTGQTKPQPAIIIVLSTLLIAALFTPLRRRIQRTIDRRFYRAKYDTARTLERFAATLRSQTDLTELTEHIVVTVQETMQPAQVSLWLRSLDHAPRAAFEGVLPGEHLTEEGAV